jgi:hypothetical protein
MTVTDAERQRIIDEHIAQQKEELRQRMSKLGKSRSPKKRKAAIKNLFSKARPARKQEKRKKRYVRKMKEMRIP